MNRRPLHRGFRWPSVLLLVLHLQACTSWHSRPLPVTEVLREDPDAIRVTTEGGSRVLEDPRILGDSLTTARVLRVCPPDSPMRPCPTTHIDGEPVTALALEDVVEVEVRRFNIWKTIGIAVPAVVLVFWFGLATSDERTGGLG